MTTPVGEQGWIATDDTFGARLALIRQRMGWNIAEAARECGVGTENWRLWEQAGRTPSRLVTIAMAIASRSGCDYLWLVHGPSRGSVISPTLRDVRALSGYVALGEKVLTRRTQPNGQPRPAVHRPAPTRPVSRTQPMRASSHRPLTPVAR